MEFQIWKHMWYSAKAVKLVFLQNASWRRASARSSITNVEIETVTSTEEAFGLIALVAKASLLLSPFVLASCSAIGVLQGGVALYHLWQADEVVALTNMSGWIRPLVIYWLQVSIRLLCTSFCWFTACLNECSD